MTVKSRPRYLLMVFAFAGDSTTTSDFAIRPAASSFDPKSVVRLRTRIPHHGGAHGAPERERRGVSGPPRSDRSGVWGGAPRQLDPSTNGQALMNLPPPARRTAPAISSSNNRGRRRGTGSPDWAESVSRSIDS